MQYPQILVYETDGLLAAMLRETAKTKRWALREPRKRESCLRLLRSFCPSVLVLKIATYAPRPALSGMDSKSVLQAEVPQASVGRISNPSYREKQQVDSLELLADVHERFPDAAVVVVGDAEDLALTNLAWDLGASYVLAPPQSRQLLPDIVVSLMQETIDKCQSSQ
jgi:DNA-binding NarL/FixJ family response regulator